MAEKMYSVQFRMEKGNSIIGYVIGEKETITDFYKAGSGSKGHITLKELNPVHITREDVELRETLEAKLKQSRIGVR